MVYGNAYAVYVRDVHVPCTSASLFMRVFAMRTAYSKCKFALYAIEWTHTYI